MGRGVGGAQGLSLEVGREWVIINFLVNNESPLDHSFSIIHSRSFVLDHSFSIIRSVLFQVYTTHGQSIKSWRPMQTALQYLGPWLVDWTRTQTTRRRGIIWVSVGVGNAFRPCFVLPNGSPKYKWLVIRFIIWLWRSFTVYKVTNAGPCGLACQLSNKATCQRKTCHYFPSTRANKTWQGEILLVWLIRPQNPAVILIWSDTKQDTD